MDEIEISLKHMLYSVIKRWRTIVISMLVFAVLLEAYAIFKTTNSATDEECVDVTSCISSLSEEQQKDVELAVATYKSYTLVYKSMSDYVQYSIRMKLDPSAISTYELQYYVYAEDGDDSKDGVTDNSIAVDIIQAYIGKLSNQEVYDKINEATGWETSESYIKELVFVNADKSADVTSGRDKASSTITVTLQATDKKSAEAMAEVIKEVIEEGKADYKKVFGDYELILQNENYYVEASPSLMTEQQSRLSAVKTAKTQLAEFKVDFTGNQLAYYNALVNNESLDAEEDKATVSATSYINIKYIVIGLALGMFLSVCWLAFVYIVGKTLRIKDDMSDVIGISVLGNVRMVANNKKLCRGIDKLIDKIFYGKGPQFSEDERLAMICASIRISAEKGDMKTIFVTGSCNDPETERIKNAILVGLRESAVTIKLGGSMVYDPEALEAMSASDGLVVVERVGYSLYEDIIREKELSGKYNVPMVGGVVLE